MKFKLPNEKNNKSLHVYKYYYIQVYNIERERIDEIKIENGNHIKS